LPEQNEEQGTEGVDIDADPGKACGSLVQDFGQLLRRGVGVRREPCCSDHGETADGEQDAEQAPGGAYPIQRTSDLHSKPPAGL